MRVINLPTDLLRAFISVIDLGGYTRAANALGRTQPAISLQMKRLEELLDATLITHEGRGLKLTEEGEALAVYARQLLRLNDEAVAKLKGRSAKGLLRIGLPTDFSVAFLQEAMLDFARDQPDVTMSIHCDLSRNVLDWLHADELDIAVALLAREANPYLVRSWEEKPIWAAARDLAVHKQQPVPLVTHPEGCEYRRRMTSALRAAGRDWRVAYTNPEISGLQSAVGSGLGVTALTRKTLLPNMRVLTARDGFPALEPIRIGLFYKHQRLTGAGLMLVDSLISHMDQAAVPASKAAAAR
ncbi:LysR substrate-binding domain-containing protein [Aestuariivirga sp.]|uniref:LysR substrate-binding domain-containing protein n=1 Tax=Aestuariivirga sp. TaxID=2650926 RepID=UPI0035944866